MPSLCLPSRCRNVSVGRLLVWPDFALLESLLVSPLARSLPPPHSLRSEQVLRPRAGDQLPCQQPSGRAREAVPSRRTQLPPVNTRSSQRHQLGTLRCRDDFSRLFLPEITFLLTHLGSLCSSVTTLSRPGKGLHDGKKNCSNIYFSSNFQSWPSSQNHFTYFGDDFIIWNIFFCQVWFKVREMHRSFNLYWRATVLQYTQSDEITFRRKNLCRSRWSFCWKIDHYGLKGKSIYIDSQFSQISLAWTVIVKMSFLDFNHQLNSPSWPNANWLK